jgi:predicted AlkP superfamily pyrophosphatase or phosphodiesterase
MTFRLVTLLVLLLSVVARAESRVLIVSIDGLRPDCLLRAEAPVIRGLMKAGSFTMWATTTEASITLPSHTSMLTGCVIAKHGMRANNDNTAATQPILVPTIFQLAKEAKISTGMAAGKSKFYVYSGPIDHAWVPKEGVTRAPNTADNAVRIITQHKPRLMFVHFGWVDAIGHGKGWGSEEQLEAIQEVDQQLGRVIAALETAGVKDETTIILSADHGGGAIAHGGLDPKSNTIPWIIVGPNVRPNVDLTRYKGLKVQTYDTFATACRLLDLSIPTTIDGKPVNAAFAQSELVVELPLPRATQPATRPAVEPVKAVSQPMER